MNLVKNFNEEMFTRCLPKISNGMSKRAFTLIEIVISTLIVAILAAGMFSAFVATQYIFNRERHRLQAFNFAREVLDKLRSNTNYQYASLNMQEGTVYDETGIITSKAVDMANLTPSLTYEISGLDTDPYKTVTVTVTWQETIENL
ncbi:MAG: type II secretion system protein [Candidatus Omnitrophota bacterium]